MKPLALGPLLPAWAGSVEDTRVMAVASPMSPWRAVSRRSSE